MPNAASQWPVPCDPRGAWWGVRGNYQWTPLPNRIICKMGYVGGLISPQFYRPSWFGPVDQTWGMEIDPEWLAQDLWGFAAIDTSCPLRWIRGRDAFVEDPIFGRVVLRSAWYRFEEPGGSEFIEAFDLPWPDDFAWRGANNDWWGKVALPDSVEIVRRVGNWNVNGWPSPDPQLVPRPQCGITNAGARPGDWQP